MRRCLYPGPFPMESLPDWNSQRPEPTAGYRQNLVKTMQFFKPTLSVGRPQHFHRLSVTRPLLALPIIHGLLWKLRHLTAKTCVPGMTV